METPIKTKQEGSRRNLLKTPISSRTPPQSPSRSVKKTVNSFSIESQTKVGGSTFHPPLNRHHSIIKHAPLEPASTFINDGKNGFINQKYVGSTPKRYFQKPHHQVHRKDHGPSYSDLYKMKNPVNVSDNLSNHQVAIRQKNSDNCWKVAIGIGLAILAIIFVLIGGAINMLMTPFTKDQLSTELVNSRSSTQESSSVTDLSRRVYEESSSSKELFMMKKTIMWLSEEVNILQSQLSLIQSYQSALLKPSKGILEELLTEEPDLACEGSGGSVIATPDTETLTVAHKSDILWGLHSFTRNLPHNPPETTIQGMIRGLGDCWGFLGGRGRLVLRLNQPSRLRSVTVSHIPSSIAPSGTITSAPRNFRVVAHKSSQDSGWLLGEFEYKQFGSWRQTFRLDSQVNDELIQIVEFQFLNNYGHPNFTCIYRVHVHGDLSDKT